MKLTDILVNDAVTADLQAQERDEAVAELVDRLVEADAIDSKLRDALVEQILEREKRGSTGFGKGVAVPHVKHEDLDEMYAVIGVSQTGVDFNALDKEPVYSIVMLLSPDDNPEEHLSTMEDIFSRLQNDQFRSFLRQATEKKHSLDLIKEHED